MSFIEHLKWASMTVARWPKWKREILGTVSPEIGTENDYRGWLIISLGTDGTALLENKIGTRRRVELVDIESIVRDRFRAELERQWGQYVELACAVWCQTDAEFLEAPIDHSETCKEAARGAKACVYEDAIQKALAHISTASTEIKQAFRELCGEDK